MEMKQPLFPISNTTFINGNNRRHNHCDFHHHNGSHHHNHRHKTDAILPREQDAQQQHLLQMKVLTS